MNTRTIHLAEIRRIAKPCPCPSCTRRRNIIASARFAGFPTGYWRTLHREQGDLAQPLTYAPCTGRAVECEDA